MRLELDENLGHWAAELIRTAGHDVATVPGQKLCGAEDSALLAVCRTEQRCLVTFDLDFGNPLLFTAAEYSGIAVIRLPGKPRPSDLVDALNLLAAGLRLGDIVGKLWIVEPNRLREHQPGN